MKYFELSGARRGERYDRAAYRYFHDAVNGRGEIRVFANPMETRKPGEIDRYRVSGARKRERERGGWGRGRHTTRQPPELVERRSGEQISR